MLMVLRALYIEGNTLSILVVLKAGFELLRNLLVLALTWCIHIDLFFMHSCSNEPSDLFTSFFQSLPFK